MNCQYSLKAAKHRIQDWHNLGWLRSEAWWVTDISPAPRLYNRATSLCTIGACKACPNYLIKIRNITVSTTWHTSIQFCLPLIRLFYNQIGHSFPSPQQGWLMYLMFTVLLFHSTTNHQILIIDKGKVMCKTQNGLRDRNNDVAGAQVGMEFRLLFKSIVSMNLWTTFNKLWTKLWVSKAACLCCKCTSFTPTLGKHWAIIVQPDVMWQCHYFSWLQASADEAILSIVVILPCCATKKKYSVHLWFKLLAVQLFLSLWFLCTCDLGMMWPDRETRS